MTRGVDVRETENRERVKIKIKIKALLLVAHTHTHTHTHTYPYVALLLSCTLPSSSRINRQLRLKLSATPGWGSAHSRSCSGRSALVRLESPAARPAVTPRRTPRAHPRIVCGRVPYPPHSWTGSPLKHSRDGGSSTGHRRRSSGSHASRRQ